MFEKQLDVAAMALLSFDSKDDDEKKIDLSGHKKDVKSYLNKQQKYAKNLLDNIFL